MNHSDVSTERALISCVYKGGFRTFVDVSDIITPDSFTVTANAVWYKCLKQLFDSDQKAVPDLPSLMAIAESSGFSKYTESDAEIDHLRSVTRFPADPSNARRFATKVRKLQVARELVGVLSDTISELSTVTGDEPISQIVGMAENRIFDFGIRAEGDGEGPVRLGDYALEYFERAMANPGVKGIPTGFPWLDVAWGGGVLPNSLDLIAARAKTGKTAFKLAVALNIARNLGLPILDIDTEMSKEEELDRLGGSLSGIPSNEIRDGLAGERAGDLRKAAAVLSNTPYFYLNVANKSNEEVLAAIRRWFVKDVGLDEYGKVKPSVVFYDYLKLTSANDGGDMKEYQTLGFMATALKNLMARYAGRCVAFGQQNREGLDYDDERALAGSDRLAWFATSLTYLCYQSEDELAAQKSRDYTHKLIPILARRGPRWKRTNFINVRTDMARGLMEEGPTRDQLVQAGGFATTEPKKRGFKKAGFQG